MDNILYLFTDYHISQLTCIRLVIRALTISTINLGALKSIKRMD